jgi:transcriptional regulator with XRE-family HTH domain
MSVPRDAATFGWLLREHRLAAGLTQDALAERSGVGLRTIQQLEAGTARPRRATALDLAEALALAGSAREELMRTATPAPRRRFPASPGPASPGDDRARRDERDDIAVALPHPTEASRDHRLLAFPRSAHTGAPVQPDARPHNLPLQTTPLIGREQLGAAIQALLLRDPSASSTNDGAPLRFPVSGQARLVGRRRPADAGRAGRCRARPGAAAGAGQLRAGAAGRD